ncbi:hypothetical protein O1Q96_11610 [Streptomyces sp. Qhu-G9]|uniref:hypothetical protein n=1 Tax=Streptomyces sp. Qhu-G9 TaxID=3452799 RepID=UPI0022AC6CB4|nr:hypothetical protein [Streptomyces aurantiacus]WAU80345.1 hypothetical protein O1Q96_11610 [Streptomyces aurantiacus]
MVGALAASVPAVMLVSTHSLEDFQELVAAGPARGFLHESALSARAVRDLLER